MGRKWALVGLWGSIITAVIVSAYVLAPRLLARYYISRLLPAGTPAADDAFRQLYRMGRWAVPTLLDAADDRDLALADLRQGVLDESARQSSFSIYEAFTHLRQSSDIERRADLCVKLLIAHWDSGFLDETSKRRLLRYVVWMAPEIPSADYSLDDTAIPFRMYERTESMTVSNAKRVGIIRDIRLFVRTDGSDSRPFPDRERVLVRYETFTENAWIEDFRASPTRSMASGASAGNSESALDAKTLGPGRHAIYIRVSIGLSTETRADSNESVPPPWYEEITFGPAEFEIASGSHETASNEPNRSKDGSNY
jgi:hypothetical protein